MSRFDDIGQALIGLDTVQTADLTKAALDDGIPALDVLNQGLLPAMKIVGERFRTGEIFLPETLLAGRAMKAAMGWLRPSFQQAGTPSRGRVAIGTVKDDIHDIGKNLVIMMLEGNGWDVIDLGVDVSTEGFCDAIRENRVNVLGMSALLTTTIPRLEEVIEALQSSGLRDRIKVIIGGAPVDQAHADRIGADGYAPNAVEAVDLVGRLVED